MARKTEEAPEVSSGLDAPRISVIDRRLKAPFGTPSREIPLKGEKKHWVVHTFYASPERPDRHYDAVHNLGWTPLKKSDLAVSEQSVGFTVNAEGYLVRGEGGKEMLMAMPAEEYAKIAQAKSDANLKRLRGAEVRSEVAQATAKEHGDEAGDHTYKHFKQQEFVGTGGDVVGD
jgi:hypothetical protein